MLDIVYGPTLISQPPTDPGQDHMTIKDDLHHLVDEAAAGLL